MYLRELFASLRRRWYLLIIAVFITAGTCFGVSHIIGPTYAAQGAVVLIPPSDPQDPDSNPFLLLGSLKQAGDIMIRSLSSDATHRKVVAAAPEGGGYTVEPDYTTSAPVLIVKATGVSPARTAATLKAVLAQVPTDLATLQQGLDIQPKNQIVSEMIDIDERPTFVIKAQVRAVVGAGAVAFGLLCLLIGAVDAVAQRRGTVPSGIHALPPELQADGQDAEGPILAGGRPSKRPEARLNR